MGTDTGPDALINFAGGLVRLTASLIRRMGISPEVGAEISICLAISAEVADMTGRLYIKKQTVPCGPESCHAAPGERLRGFSTQMISI